MGLGLLGAFGKTNAPDVVGGLFRQYNEGLVQAENIRRTRAADALAERQEARQQAKFAMDKAEYDYQHQKIKVDDALSKIPYERTRNTMRQFYQMSGVMDENGYARRMDMASTREEALKWAEKDPKRNIDNLLQDMDDHIAGLQDKLKKTKKPEEIAAINKEIQQNVQARNNIYGALPQIRQHYAEKWAEEEAKDPGGETRRLAREKIKAEADAAKELANKRAADAEASRATGGKVLTPGASKEIQKNVLGVVARNLFPGLAQGRLVRVEINGKMRTIDPKDNNAINDLIRQGDELNYEFYNEVLVRAQEIYARNKGLIPPIDAAHQAYDQIYHEVPMEVRQRRQAERVGRGSSYNQELRKGAPAATQEATDYKKPPDYEKLYSGGGWEDAALGIETSNKRVVIAPTQGQVYTLTPPESMSEEDAQDMFETLESAVAQKKKTPMEIFHILKYKYGWNVSFYDAQNPKTVGNNPYPGEQE